MWNRLGRRPGLGEGFAGSFGYYRSLSSIRDTPFYMKTVTTVCVMIAEQMRKEGTDPITAAHNTDSVVMGGTLSLEAVRATSSLAQRPVTIYVPQTTGLTVNRPGVN
eukprot:1356199-Rhodomonas_salina.2